MRIFVLNPPFLPRYSRSQRSPAVTKSGTLYYPIWLAYATGVLEQAGHQVRLVDAPATGYNLTDVVHMAEEFQPRLLVLDTSVPSMHYDVQVAAGLKQTLPESFLVFVGLHVSALPEEMLRAAPVVDAVARREYEYTLRELAEVLDGGGDLSQVLGLSFRVRPPGGNGTGPEIIHTPDRPPIEDLDALPFVSDVYRRHLRVEDYFYAITPWPSVTIITGRGCPYRCSFCLIPQTFQGHRYRRRSVENVVAEFEYVAEHLPQVKHIFIEDDTFTVDKERARQLGRELAWRNLKLTWAANARADVDRETLEIMHAGGLRMLCVGFESGNQSVLNSIHKGITVPRMMQFMDDARKAGVLIHGCFIMGNLGETPESMQATLDLAKKINPDTAQFYPLMVYPGTTAFRWAEEQGYISRGTDFREWITEDGMHSTVINQPGLSAKDVVAFCDYARRSFYLRPTYLWSKLKQVTTRPDEFQRVAKAAWHFLPHLFRRRGRPLVRSRAVAKEVKERASGGVEAAAAETK
ncbi:MAG TPA: radical SAM protein [Anaerolineae bacterium]|nr:radical SAM protein [Anaerolineae bacterium]HIQ05523.1 radical SAM protein [Anaerolineae bacterium]